MNSEKIYQTLEFYKIQQTLKQSTQTDLANTKIDQMKIETNIDIINRLQNETDEAYSIIKQSKNIPIPRLANLSTALRRLKISASLNGIEISQIGKVLSTARQISDFFEDLAQEDKFFPQLSEWADQVVILPDIEKLIQVSIAEDGSVLSSASAKLGQIRRHQSNTENQVRTQLNQLLKTKANELSDNLITMRNGRYVLPVKAEFRHRFGGTVHDQSSTGQTLYIEPQSIVQLNNKRTELQAEEQREIEVILNDISLQLEPYQHDISLNESIIAELDFIQARAMYAKAINAVKPKFSVEQKIAMWQARHPLIDAEKIVPNDILIGDQYQALIITGPNTGGKTILLKTLGIIQMMGQSGLHVPCEEGSQLGVFDQIFADIGDEQSIEQNLSTFSSHMTNIVSILNQATHQSLLLFDELGSGTDPQEGASLAMAILDYVRKLGATVMATTHYPELKVYAHEAPNTINASMEFDSDTLSPTYRLLIGVPGRSNALEISKRLGLREDILENARSGISQDNQSINEMVANLERERRQSELNVEQTQRELDEAEKLLDDLRTEYQRWMSKKETIEQNAIRQANEKVAQAEEEADKLIREIRDLQLQQGNDATIKEHVLIDKKAQVSQLKQAEKLKKNKVLQRAKKQASFNVGDEVEVLSYGQRGTIIEQVDKDTYNVQLGILKMKIDANDLRPLESVEPKTTVNVQRKAGNKVQPTLDIRGERVEEGINRLNQYLDAALLSNHPRVTIIHGKGTGALRSGVQQVLKNHLQVDHFEYSPPSSGGDGSTIVYFK
ncbi:endonuclease MutS2 [Fundicoccus culcitae]|uniref:Endonuclease MutS2 n=1 Tax=Fundicoccus culcitae TaxID=2969821 RepID=A0ABY5P7A0_9LACT|nr:endonuclease MutS2 [Fundicoccus culcitae]UUX34614.1 endonuclease MutS2 [Fundicoccus culcitae]